MKTKEKIELMGWTVNFNLDIKKGAKGHVYGWRGSLKSETIFATSVSDLLYKIKH